MCGLCCNPPIQWFKDQGIVEKLVDFIHPAIDSKVYIYIYIYIYIYVQYIRTVYNYGTCIIIVHPSTCIMHK